MHCVDITPNLWYIKCGGSMKLDNNTLKKLKGIFADKKDSYSKTNWGGPELEYYQIIHTKWNIANTKFSDIWDIDRKNPNLIKLEEKIKTYGGILGALEKNFPNIRKRWEENDITNH